MEDHQVRHLQQSFVTLKICIRLEIVESTQLGWREPILRGAKTGGL